MILKFVALFQNYILKLKVFGGNTPDWATPTEVFSYYKNFKFETLMVEPTTASPQLAALYAQVSYFLYSF